MKKLIIAMTSAFILFANSAMSIEMRPSIGISGNSGVYAATGIENNFNEAGTAIDETTKEHGAFNETFMSIFAEMSLNDSLSIGIDYVPVTIDTPENTSNDGGVNTNKVYVTFEDLTTIYAKLNVPLGGTYLKVGYSTVNVISNETMNSGSKYGNDRTDAISFGLGYAHELADGLAVRAEITGSEFSDVTTTNGQTNKTEIKVEDMIGARGTISVVKSF
mgnify:CR=1 FL=1